MPSGKTHDMINITVLLAILAGLYYFSTWQKSAIVTKYLDIYTVLAFLSPTYSQHLFLSPDLDTKSRPYKRWKMLSGIPEPGSALYHSSLPDLEAVYRTETHCMFCSPLMLRRRGLNPVFCIDRRMRACSHSPHAASSGLSCSPASDPSLIC